MDLLNAKLILKGEMENRIIIQFYKEDLRYGPIEIIDYLKDDKYYNQKEESFNDFVRVNKYTLYDNYKEENIIMYLK